MNEKMNEKVKDLLKSYAKFSTEDKKTAADMLKNIILLYTSLMNKNISGMMQALDEMNENKDRYKALLAKANTGGNTAGKKYKMVK